MVVVLLVVVVVVVVRGKRAAHCLHQKPLPQSSASGGLPRALSTRNGIMSQCPWPVACVCARMSGALNHVRQRAANGAGR